LQGSELYTSSRASDLDRRSVIGCWHSALKMELGLYGVVMDLFDIHTNLVWPLSYHSLVKITQNKSLVFRHYISIFG